MNAPRPLSILVLSDLHYGALTEHLALAPPNQPPSSVLTNAKDLVESLIGCVQSHSLSVDCILVPGDLTSRATPVEFAGCVSVVTQIADALAVPRDAVFYTFGNHDTNWLVSTLAGENPPDELKNGYEHVAGAIGCLFVPFTPFELQGPIAGSALYRRDRLELVILNTGYYCVHDQAVKNGKLGEAQLEWVQTILRTPRPDECWRVLALHHHPFNYPYPVQAQDISTLQEGSELLEAMGAGSVDLVCHGHRHHPRQHTEMRTGWQAPITFLCAGSVGVNSHHRLNGHIPNLFHVIVLEARADSGAAIGETLTFEYTPIGWVPLIRRPAVPLDGRRRFGSCASRAKCDAAAKQLVEEVLVATRETMLTMPPFGELHVDLQCLEPPQLATVLSEAAREAGAELLGRYGEGTPPILRRVN